jgi:hypothetical protein
MTSLLGLTLDEALTEIRALGLSEPRVERAQPEKHPEGTERVVRARPGEILTARFPDRVAP